ncbi:hypothetical protein OG711_29045 [Streptomyces uncialis]|uniref:hypothetical protein n=1 Tax=Streptomyces uncialis TaxID=1048205 RepID=UPI002E325515|nr:hypothetical protein [Streptomyces uncialis]WTE10424.1 hypothetical protein OG924_09050 [Streptomyces uncialis]
MVFTHRIAALAAVVAIPLGIAVTSYALTDSPDDRKVPQKVELESGSPSGSAGSPRPTPSDETVAPPSMDGTPSGTTPDGGRSTAPDKPTDKPTKKPTSKPPAGDDNNDDGPGGDDDGPGGDDFGDDG